MNSILQKSLDILKSLRKLDKNKILIIVAIVAIVVTGVLIYAKRNGGITFPSFFGLSNSQIGQRAVDYINSNQLAQSEASLEGTSMMPGSYQLVKVKIKIGSNTFDSYATKDGKLFFPQGFDVAPKKDSQNTNNTQDTDNQPSAEDIEKAAASVTKVASPMLEAYVVSRCPYGLQMQRAMAEAINGAPSLAQYIKVRYIGSVNAAGNGIEAMHGAAEATENLRQICIRDEQPSKYWPYVACQMKASGQETACEKSTGVDSGALSACMASPSRGVAYAKQDFNLSAKYGVQGSPTMILNGASANESSFGGRSAEAIKKMVCAGATTEPSFCSQALNTAQAAVSFSSAYAGSGSASNSGAGCGAAQ
jgi:hypothetical protein